MSERVTVSAGWRLALYPLFSLVLLLPLLVRFYWPAGDGLDVTGHALGRDFINAWAAPRLAFRGDLAMLFDLTGYPVAIGTLFGHSLPFHNWSYPPTALLLFWPFAQPPYFAGLLAWTLLTFTALAVVALSQVAPRQRLLALVLLLVAPACLINAVGGQNGFLVGALLIGGVLLIDRRPVAAGVLLGLLTFKPHLGLAVACALVALRAWRVIAFATVTAVAFAGAATALLGLKSWRLYATVTAPYQELVLREFYGFYTIMMASVFSGARTFGIDYSVALTIQIAVAVLVLALTAWAVRQTADPCHRVLVIAAATPLATPYAFNYDLTILAVPLAWILVGRLPWPAEWRPVLVLAWVTPLAIMYLGILGVGLLPFLAVGVFGLAVLTVAGDRLRGASAAIAPPGQSPDQLLASQGAPPI